MKNIQSFVRSTLVLGGAVAILAAPAVHAAPISWSDPAGGNWSVATNWSSSTLPGSGDDVSFLDLGTNPTTMDINFTIDSLAFSQDDGGTHTTTINTNLTLQITDSGTGNPLYVGSTTAATSATTQVPVVINGPGTLSISGSGNMVVCQGFSSSGSHMATLDLSGLATFDASVGQLLVGFSTGTPNRPSGTLLLAKTNTIILNGATAPQLQVQFSEVNANGSTLSLIQLGQVNNLYLDQMEVGGAKGNGTLEFNNTAFSDSTLVLRNTDQASAMTSITVGDDSYVATGNSSVGVLDLSLGSVDALVGTVTVGKGNAGASAGSSTGTIDLGAGTFTVTTTMTLGQQVATSGTAAATGSVYIENNGLFSSGATLVVEGSLVLGKTNTSGPTITGNLDVEIGGTLEANSIVTGGGVSDLTLDGTLWLTNSAGTLSLPISTLTVGDGATLNLPASNGGAAINASNVIFSPGNTINITSIPAIASYPATFNLITYQTAGTGGGNFLLGTLPTGASPAYQGQIVDTGNGVVQLKLTHGPVTILSLLWTGANGNSWDTSSENWLYQGSPDAFFNGAAATFNDAATQTNVNLTESLSPSSVTVSNALDLYTFEGAGNIAGSTALTKEGTNTLILDNSGVDGFQSVTIAAGTLQLGDNDTNGALSTLAIADYGALVFDSAATLNLSADISGTGSLTVTNTGSLTLSGVNDYGATYVDEGSLIINGLNIGTGSVMTSAGTLLGGIGSVSGPVTVGGELEPGNVGSTGGEFSVSNELTLSPGATLSFGLSPTDTSDVGSATLAVTGDLIANNNQITVNFSGPPQQNAYPVITYTGSKAGTFNPTVLGTHYATSVDTTSTPNTVNVVVTGASGANLVWTSQSSSTWDTVSTNWTNTVTEQPSVFYAGDNALFDDTVGVQTTITIPTGVTVTPLNLTNNSALNQFTITGGGSIGGTANIVKTNTSMLILDTANTLTGTVDIQAGTLVTENGASISTSSGVTVENGATLDFDGQNVSPAVISASGPGVANEGAIYNSGGANNNNFRELVLLGDLTIGGSGTWEINDSGGPASVSSGGNPFSITKVGGNEILIANMTTFDAAISNIDVQAGTLAFTGLSVGMGDPAATNIVESGATEAFGNATATWSKNFLINGGTVLVQGGGDPTFEGNVFLNGSCIFNVTGLAMQIDGAVAGTGDLIKEGSAPLTLETNNTYTGDTSITTGTLILSTNATISDSADISIDTGTALDVSQRSDATLTLASGQQLDGVGTLDGNLTASAGSTVAPGTGGAGTLTVTNAVHLLGTTSVTLDVVNSTNTVLASGATITYGGALNVTFANNSPVSGAAFKLFQAKAYAGAFSSIVPPTPGTGLTWDTSALTTTGTLRVSGASSPTPRFGGVTLSGTNLVFSGSNGVASTSYYVLTSTNLALPLSKWTPIATNSFDGSGDFRFTNGISSSVPQRYYIIEGQ